MTTEPTDATVEVPRLFVLTDRRRSEAAGRSLQATVAAALDAGAPAILLREKDLPAEPRRALAVELLALTEQAGVRLIVASDAGLAAQIGAAGVHLAQRDTSPRWWADGLLTGRSCHDAAEVRAATAEGADYVTVSPVATSGSKPGYGPGLGEGGLFVLVEVAGAVPVVALGGVTAANADGWRAAGAHGLAVMGAVMGADDPGRVVGDLLARLLA